MKTPNVDPLQFCDSVISILTEQGWCKTRMLDADGKSCLLGAIGRAAGIVTETTKVGASVYMDIDNWIVGVKALDRAFRAECAAAKTCGFSLIDNVVFYNDQRCFKQADAVSFIQRVRARLG